MAKKWVRFIQPAEYGGEKCGSWEECWAYYDSADKGDCDRLHRSYVVKWYGRPGYYCVRSPLNDTNDTYIVQEKFDDLEVAKTALLLLTA